MCLCVCFFVMCLFCFDHLMCVLFVYLCFWFRLFLIVRGCVLCCLFLFLFDGGREGQMCVFVLCLCLCVLFMLLLLF